MFSASSGIPRKSWSECLHGYRKNTSHWKNMSEEGPTSWRNVTITMKVTRRTSPVPPCSFFYAYLLNGIYSVNRSGKLSVTFGFGGRVKLLEEELIRFNHKLLQDVVILDGDYQQTEKYLGSKSFFYYKPVNVTEFRRWRASQPGWFLQGNRRSRWQMNAFQLRPPSGESSGHFLRRPLCRIPYPANQYLPFYLFHRGEERSGQWIADSELLILVFRKRI